jgi:hypothetical protein
MSWKPRLEAVGVGVALLLCAAFIASFLFGLGGRPAAPTESGATIIADPEPPLRPAGRVEVLNASGRTGLARAVTDRLRAGGFDVVYFGNAAASAGDSSVVLDRIGNDAVARAAARHLGIAAVRTEPDTALFLDATVIVGKDWRTAQDDVAPADPDSWRSRISRWLRPGR